MSSSMFSTPIFYISLNSRVSNLILFGNSYFNSLVSNNYFFFSYFYSSLIIHEYIIMSWIQLNISSASMRMVLMIPVGPL